MGSIFSKKHPEGGGAHSVLPLSLSSFFIWFFLSFFLFLSLSLSLSLLSLSVSVCLCLSLSVSVCLCLSVSLSLSLSLSLYPFLVCLYIYIYLSLSLSLSISLSLSRSLSLSLFLSFSFSLSFYKLVSNSTPHPSKKIGHQNLKPQPFQLSFETCVALEERQGTRRQRKKLSRKPGEQEARNKIIRGTRRTTRRKEQG